MGNRYDKYKDSGIAWIGEIPEHWEVCSIKQIMKNKSIKGFPDETVLSLYRDFGVIPKDSRDDNHNVTSEDTSNYKLVENGDFVINKMKAWQGSMAISDFRGIISPAYYICKIFSPKVARKFIHYLLRNESYKAEYMRLSTGMRIGQWDLNIDDFLQISTIIPSLSEQQSIATYLDQKCGEIDELITLQEKMITKLQSYKQSVITEAVTKGLDKNVPLKDSGIEWIGKIPKHWDVKRLKYFGNNYNGLTYSPNDICNSQEGTIVLRSSNIKDNKLCFDDNVYVNKEIPTKLFVNKGDILICSRNGSASLIGKAALIETDIKATFGAFMMIFKGNNIHHKYLYYIVTSCISQYKWLFTTATINQLTSSMLGEIFAPFICDRLEQQSIANYLDQKCSEIDELISIKQQKIEKLKDYKKSLIFECVTGKRKV